GGMYLAFGMVCALLEAKQSGQGQVVDTAMVDGAASLMNMFWAMKAGGMWNPERGTNMLDTGAPFYDVYECSDGNYISIGSIEPQFYAELMELSGLGQAEDFPRQMERSQWPAMKERVAEVFKGKTRDEWCEIMEHSDVCFAPVLTMEEATEHPHNVERNTFVEYGGMTQAAPAPRFSRTSPELTRPAPHGGQHTDEILAGFGFDAEDIAKLHQTDAVA
ncbi:MAG: CaiB/BaiF CoA transferase family protein, partial [Acidimicrobiales bacterium]